MRILYLSTSYIPSRRASSIHVVRMCQALAKAGHAVTLVAKGSRHREEADVSDVFAFYGVEPTFSLKKLSHPNARGGGAWYAARAGWFMRSARASFDLVYSRDLVGAWLAVSSGAPTVLEAHGLPASRLEHLLWRAVMRSRRLRRLVVISAALEGLLRAERLLPRWADTTVAHDGADPVPAGDGASAGQRRAVPQGQPARVGYTGSLYKGRGIELITSLAARMPAVVFHIIGGNERDLTRWRSQAVPGNVVFEGFVEPGLLPQQYARFSLVLMPYQRSVAVATGTTDTSRWMSPMKMFEYMAAGCALVASDLPVLREVLVDGRNALLVPPDELGAWERAVRLLLSDPEQARRLGEQARADLLASYTWEARARRVVDGLASGQGRSWG